MTLFNYLVVQVLLLGTLISDICTLVLKGGNILSNEGWGKFWIAFKHWGNRKSKDDYLMWIKTNEPSHSELAKQTRLSKNFIFSPKISIITPVYNTPPSVLKRAIESVLNQTYYNWELCIADGNSTISQVKEVIQEYIDRDSRIHCTFLDVNKGIGGNSNEAIALATGDYITFLDHDDELAPFALFEIVKVLNENPDLNFIYSDEDKIDLMNIRQNPFFKPDWSPDYFLACNYLCHLSVIRKSLVDKVQGFSTLYEGSQDYDLFLRVIEQCDEKTIFHIPKILYHWRIIPGSVGASAEAKPYAYISAKKALSDSLERRNIEVSDVSDGLWTGSYRVHYVIKNNPKVSIIIPSKDNISILKKCITSILDKTDYDNYEIIVVDNQSTDDDTFSYYKKISEERKIRILDYNKPFNYSVINNYAVSKVDGKFILLLNNDVEVIKEDWLKAMLEHSHRKEIGAVGAKLLYPDNRVQHAGVIIGIKGVAGHSHRLYHMDELGYYSRLRTIQNLSAVTGACLLMKRSIFLEVGGFDENLAVAFNDVDLCLKIRQKGYLILYTPFATLYHHESLSRGYEDTPEKQKRFSNEIQYFLEKWGEVIDAGDPYYSPNLTLDREDFSIRV